jgi:hypothetical protein
MAPGERDEAYRLAAALVVAVIDHDTEAAGALLGGSSHQVLAQAATDLARWIAACVDGDMDEFRADLASALRA